MLKLSRKVCGQRAAARDGHEGGLQGHSTAVFQAGKFRSCCHNGCDGLILGTSSPAGPQAAAYQAGK